MNRLGILTATLVLAGLVAMIPVVAVKVIATVYAVAAVVFIAFSLRSRVRKFYAETRGMADMRQIDPTFSYSHYGKRAKYLMQLFLSSANADFSRARPFLDARWYEHLCQSRRQSGKLVLDFEYDELAKQGAVIQQSGRYHIPVEWGCRLVSIDENRQIKEEKRTLKYHICRGENVHEQVRIQAEWCACRGCNRAINLTATGKCRFCNMEYDISQLDWPIGWLDEASFFERG